MYTQDITLTSGNKQHHINWWKKHLDQEINTTELQATALEMFLNDIGYDIVENEHDGTWHIECMDKYASPKYMKLDVAVALYNDELILKNKGNGYLENERYGFVLKTLDYHLAQNTKALQTIYLQRVKGELKASKNIVKFINQGE